jgi:hypothetical protein
VVSGSESDDGPPVRDHDAIRELADRYNIEYNIFMKHIKNTNSHIV